MSFGSRTTCSHSRSDIRFGLEASFLEAETFSTRPFLSDIGSRYAVHQANVLNFFKHEELVLKTCRDYRDRKFANMILTISEKSDYDLTKLKSSIIPMFWWAVSEPFLKSSGGHSRTYGSLLKAYTDMEKRMERVKQGSIHFILWAGFKFYLNFN
ncbi:Oidioi.mRNA.OKI2018_I69.chr2.g7039.t1.cds [Oikopleura dioica]|uniref:Oidioi.mRNA.OKI2018_I69.chr2.g7039.t1.cds n=1 Tax=Oikopleura dioica TaxID=34765 RepID=A0ABN7T9P9_OIKDI|nr:Oidioi.mRNA.OKI2018_I69.chr2.g7039.t1.cds [Oikopleura dioica]